MFGEVPGFSRGSPPNVKCPPLLWVLNISEMRLCFSKISPLLIGDTWISSLLRGILAFRGVPLPLA